MIDYTPPLAQLIEELKKIPGIGRKSAQRIAFYLFRTDKKNALALADAIVQAREKIVYCSLCNNISAVNPARFVPIPTATAKKSAWSRNLSISIPSKKPACFTAFIMSCWATFRRSAASAPTNCGFPDWSSGSSNGAFPRNHSGHQPDHRRQRHGPLFDRNSPAV